jgi:hypothetical protein
MKTPNLYPEYAAIEQHIRRANIGRVVGIAEAIATVIVHVWKSIEAPPRPAAVIINGRYHWAGHAAANR